MNPVPVSLEPVAVMAAGGSGALPPDPLRSDALRSDALRSAALPRVGLPRKAWVRQLMGMPISIHLRGGGVESESVARAVEAAFADLAWVEEVFSPFRSNSQLSRLRRGELSLTECVPELEQVWRLCELAEQATGGAFSAFLPDAEGEQSLWSRNQFAPEGPARRQDASSGRQLFNPTGLVKGWAIERVATVLAGLDDVAYCINAGGDIAVGGRTGGDPSPTPWRLGIESPYHRGRVAHVVELVHGGMATSGTAARGLHLIDPRSGLPVRRSGSVSVIGPSIMWADVWATALFVDPSARAHFPRERGWSQVWI